MTWLGLDIGGANLKAADGRGWAQTVPFALWRNPAGLADAIAALIRQAPNSRRLAVTMTGELCDCFRSKSEGVRYILSAVEQAAAGCGIGVYLVDGRFVSVREAIEQPHLAAASNWHALARFAARYTEGRAGLLVDIGSTTTDLVPLVDGQPSSAAQSDTDRLLAGELVYTGVGRTPLCAVVRTLPWQGKPCPVAAELFSTTADAYVLLGDRPEEPDADWTADGQPLTREHARERLARMICADADTFNEKDALVAAKAVRAAQVAEINDAIAKVTAAMPQASQVWITSGSGGFLADILSRSAPLLSLGSKLGSDASSAAPAYAVACLAAEMAIK